MNKLLQSSIGIIGGADGPTAIFIASKTSPWIYVSAVGVALVGLYFFYKYYHKRKQSK